MALVMIRGEQYEIDVTEEIEKYDWEGARWSHDKLIAKSPFRIDNSPSFFVTLEGEYAGAWGDSGSSDEFYASGGFVKLISLLEGRDYDEVADEYVERFSFSDRLSEHFTIPRVKLSQERNKLVLPEVTISRHKTGSDYVVGRGISDYVQRAYDIRTHETQSAVVIPWRNIDGTLAAIKYRRTDSKKFWYEQNGEHMSNLVYGMNRVYDDLSKEVVICESEIDAMSWLTCGVKAIALGGANLSDKQTELIRKSPIERLIMSLDKDEPGRKLGRQIIQEFRNVGYVKLPEGCKDANDVLMSGTDLSELVVYDYLHDVFNRNF